MASPPNASPPVKKGSWFTRFAKATAHASGRPSTFMVAFAVIVVWAMTGPMFHYSDTWQLIINTGTTVVTFLMVFLIQNTQNRDSQAIHVKLDELIRAIDTAKNTMLDLDDLSDEELDKLRANYAALAKKAEEEKIGRKGTHPSRSEKSQ
jgi:low affinity Fe/Cu permease